MNLAFLEESFDFSKTSKHSRTGIKDVNFIFIIFVNGSFTLFDWIAFCVAHTGMASEFKATINWVLNLRNSIKNVLKYACDAILFGSLCVENTQNKLLWKRYILYTQSEGGRERANTFRLNVLFYCCCCCWSSFWNLTNHKQRRKCVYSVKCETPTKSST